MTVHSAKGLEFPVVFMVGMENGLFPSAAALEKESEMEEARRLCYVGITRAKERLYMTSAEVRRVFGRTMSYPQSDFISEIKPELREYVSVTGETREANNRGSVTTPRSPQYNSHSLRSSYGSFESRNFGGARKSSSNYRESTSNSVNSGELLTASEATIGRKVKHDKFGVGTIVSAVDDNGDKKLTIAFDNQGIKMLN